MPWAFFLAWLRTGKSSAARMAMIAITTNNSIRVKPSRRREMGIFPEARCELFIQLFMPLSWPPAAGRPGHRNRVPADLPTMFDCRFLSYNSFHAAFHRFIRDRQGLAINRLIQRRRCVSLWTHARYSDYGE